MNTNEGMAAGATPGGATHVPGVQSGALRGGEGRPGREAGATGPVASKGFGLGKAPAAGKRPPMVGPNGAAAAMPADQPKKHRARTVGIIVGLVLAALVIWLLLFLFACNGNQLLDPTARDGQAPYKSAEEIQAELDRVVDEGMFNISIATAIKFDDGTADGTAYIENVPGNRYLMKVSITEDDTGETLYESGMLKPNQFIEKITLAKDLDAGNYPATATFTAVDPTTYEEVGQAAAKISIDILG